MSIVTHELKLYVQKQVQHFDLRTLWSPSFPMEYGAALFWWIAPAFAYVWFENKIVSSSYLEAAIFEGLGPHLWNVMGFLGVLLFGLTILFPRSKYFATGTYHVLINAHAVGALAIGLLLGQLTIGLASVPADIAVWRVWLVGLGGAFVLLLMLLFNFCLWYLGRLTTLNGRSNSFFNQVEKLSLPFRAVTLCLVLALVAVLFFLSHA